MSRNTFMVFGNTYIKTPDMAKTSILESINKAVKDADIDFVIMVGELTISAAVDQFKAAKYVMDNSPVPVYVTASNHDLVYTHVDGKRRTNDNFARFSKILENETEYTTSKDGSYFIMLSHADSIGTNFAKNELVKLENNTSYDFVYLVTEGPVAFNETMNLDSKPIIGIRGGNRTGVELKEIDGRHVKIIPTENNANDNEDDYLILKENEGFVVVDSYVDRSLNESFKIIIDRSAETCSVETL